MIKFNFKWNELPSEIRVQPLGISVVPSDYDHPLNLNLALKPKVNEGSNGEKDEQEQEEAEGEGDEGNRERYIFTENEYCPDIFINPHIDVPGSQINISITKLSTIEEQRMGLVNDRYILNTDPLIGPYFHQLPSGTRGPLSVLRLGSRDACNCHLICLRHRFSIGLKQFVLLAIFHSNVSDRPKFLWHSPNEMEPCSGFFEGYESLYRNADSEEWFKEKTEGERIMLCQYILFIMSMQERFVIRFLFDESEGKGGKGMQIDSSTLGHSPKRQNGNEKTKWSEGVVCSRQGDPKTGGLGRAAVGLSQSAKRTEATNVSSLSSHISQPQSATNGPATNLEEEKAKKKVEKSQELEKLNQILEKQNLRIQQLENQQQERHHLKEIHRQQQKEKADDISSSIFRSTPYELAIVSNCNAENYARDEAFEVAIDQLGIGEFKRYYFMARKTTICSDSMRVHARISEKGNCKVYPIVQEGERKYHDEVFSKELLSIQLDGIHNRIDLLETRIGRRFDSFEKKMENDLNGLRTEIKGEIKSEIGGLETRLKVFLGDMFKQMNDNNFSKKE